MSKFEISLTEESDKFRLQAKTNIFLETLRFLLVLHSPCMFQTIGLMAMVKILVSIHVHLGYLHVIGRV